MNQIEERGEAVDLGELACQRGGEVKAEAIHVHLCHPVAQRVHDELEDLRGAHEEGVAGSRRVEVVLTVPVHQSIVRGVVDASEGQGGAHVVTLGRVVVHHVEDDLDVGGVQGLDHCLELGHLSAGFLRGRVGVMRREVADRVVSPVVRQALGLQRRIVGELVDRHELHGGDAELREVLDDRRVRHAGVGAAQLLGDVGVTHRHALDVRLVDDRLRVVVPRAAVALPVEEGVDDDGVHGCLGGVSALEAEGVVCLVGEKVERILELSLDGLGVGVEEKLGGVAAQASSGVPGALDAVAVALAGPHLRDVDVPNVGIHLGHGDAHFVELVV